MLQLHVVHGELGIRMCLIRLNELLDCDRAMGVIRLTLKVQEMFRLASQRGRADHLSHLSTWASPALASRHEPASEACLHVTIRWYLLVADSSPLILAF